MRIIAQLLLTFLLNSSWQVALITGCAAVCDWLLRGTAARYRHALWVCTLLLSLSLPALSCSRLIGSSLIPKPASAGVSSKPIVVSTILSAEVGPIETPVPPTRVATQPARRNFWSSPVPVSQKLAAGLVGLYALFLAYRGANLFRAWRRTRTIVRSAYEFQFPEPARTIIQQCQAAVGVSRVRIFCSGLVPVPITVGFLHPLIILPESLLHEVDRELLTSAIGHELVHVARRDYLANLIYEFIFLPLSFHPAAALVRRRIKQTRELCCDESVAAKLLSPEIYARSLVRLIGSVPLTRRLATNTTIGITESDNLEVRIMSLLKTPKFTPRRKTLLLITALLVLAVPCLAATSFALALDIERQEPTPATAPQSNQQIERRNQERAREELKRQTRELREQIKVAPQSQRSEIEIRLREVQRALEEHERVLREFERQRGPNEERMRQAQERLKEAEGNQALADKNRPEYEARMREAREKLAQLEREYRNGSNSAAQFEEIRRAQQELEQQQEQVQKEKQKEEKLKQENREMRERKERAEMESREKIEMEKRDGKGEGKGEGIREMKMRKERVGQEREERARLQAELTARASISMDRAIQIATSKYPGKVLTCSLGRDGDMVFYHLVIITTQGDKSSVTYVWLSATDGQILKTEKE
jgi:beta-lactamase regulating signal transducer with metallopeptidase domain/uncharacterized membrane protein YkoI